MKRFLPLLILFLWFPNVSHAAITVDTTVSVQAAASATSYTQSMTLSGSNPYLVIGSFNNDNLSTMTATWNGTAMIKECSVSDGALYVYMFTLANPTLGTHNLVISTGGIASNIWIEGANFNGLANSLSEAHSCGTTASATSYTNTLTTISNNSLHASVFTDQNGGSTPTAGAGTQVVNGNRFMASSPYAVTPAGSNTLNASDVLGPWTSAGVSLAPATATVTLTPILTSWINWIF